MLTSSTAARRVAAAEVPLPYAKSLEQAALPSAESLHTAALETLAVGCGSVAAASAWRALRAATWAGVACCGAAGASQKPRALMMSAGVSGFASADFPAAGLSRSGCRRQKPLSDVSPRLRRRG